MTRMMKTLTAVVLVSMALVAGVEPRAETAGDGNRQDRTAPPASSIVPGLPEQAGEALASPMPASAEDMLRAMETMPAHGDDDACCRARKKDAPGHGHGH